MKVGIITFHFASNCGAALQCLALSEVLKKMGHEVCVIDYRPSYHTNRYKPLKNPFYYGKKATEIPSQSLKRLKGFKYLKGFIGSIYSWRFYFKQKEINDCFNCFVNKYLNLTSRYSTLKELQTCPPMCDLYISGSDQVWSSILTGGTLDAAYLLDFGPLKTKRISYAAGVNIKDSNSILNEYSNLLNRFQSISLRESKYRGDFEKILLHPEHVRVDLDPTLLLEAEEYQKYIPSEELETDPYILIYTMQDPSQDKVFKEAKKLSQQMGLKVIDISNNTKTMGKENFDTRVCGPAEFLWYIKHARFVITNSYHSTVFSILFKTSFFAIPHSQTGYRITELLDALGMSQYYAENIDAAKQHYELNFSVCRPILQNAKKRSLDYLESHTADI